MKCLLFGWTPISRRKFYQINESIIKVLNAQMEFSQMTRRDNMVLAHAITKLHGLNSIDEAFMDMPKGNKKVKTKDVAFG